MDRKDLNDNSVSEEVNLSEISRWIGNGFRRLGSSALYSLASLRNIFFKNKYFFLGIIILGLVLGATYSELIKKKYYRSTMVLSCKYLNTQILANTIDKLNALCNEVDKEGLAAELGLDTLTARNISGFEFESFISEDDVVEMEVLKEQLNNVAAEKKDIVDKVIKKLEIDNKDAYQISALVFSPNAVKPLETALVKYFKEKGYIKSRVEINKINLNKRKIKLLRESRKLDSLKMVIIGNLESISKTSRGSNNVILNEEAMNDPMKVFTEDLGINNEILAIDRDLYIQPDFEVVDGFTTFKQPQSAGLGEILAISFFLSLLMGYLILGAWKFDKLLAGYSLK
jgi:hypothetical protein